MTLTESIVEDAALAMPMAALTPALSQRERETVGHGSQLAPGEYADGTLTPALSQGEREQDGEVVQFRFASTLTQPLPWGEEKERGAIRRLNPAIPEDALSGGILDFQADIPN